MSEPSSTTAQEIERILRERLAPTHIEVIDDSVRHAGHAGASEGGHFRVIVVSSAFSGKSLVDRHRMVNAALGDLFAGRIHALELRTRTPGEASAAGRP